MEEAAKSSSPEAMQTSCAPIVRTAGGLRKGVGTTPDGPRPAGRGRGRAKQPTSSSSPGYVPGRGRGRGRGTLLSSLHSKTDNATCGKPTDLATESPAQMMTKGISFESRLNSTQLPATICSSLAITAYKHQRKPLVDLILHCLPSITNSLCAQDLISQDVYEKVTDQYTGKRERGMVLLDCVQSRIETAPSDFKKLVEVLKTERYLESVASQLVQDYCNLSSTATSTQGLPTVSPAISRYANYLKTVYKKSLISPDSKWPPTPSKEYIQLALVKGQSKCREEYIGYILEGNIQEAIGDNEKISIDQILEPCDGQDMRLILIEGAPGIGKSTFAWELCRQWEVLACMKQYNLVVLLRLREKRVQKVNKVSNLFFSHEFGEQKAVVEEVMSCHGKGVLFILDGFDELPSELQHEGLLIELMKKNVLPDSAVVVTSRPTATAELLTNSRPLIQKRIQILGFTQDSVEDYASSIFSDPETLENFKSYISASKNPAINSLMYVPINAAIIVQIYSESKPNSSLPYNLTQLYTQLCLTILNKYMKTVNPLLSVSKFEDLPKDLYKSFLELAKLAFDGIESDQIIFHGNSVPSDLNHFGFLDAVTSLCGGGETSYNFLHLTLQEFFAAYHISQLPDHGVALFKECVSIHWHVVWRFVAGLTKFYYFNCHTSRSHLFFRTDYGRPTLTTLFIHSLFESQIVIDFERYFGTKECGITYSDDATPFDYFALGFCIVNCITKASSVSIYGGYSKEFIDGLIRANSPHTEHGVIRKLYFGQFATSFVEPYDFFMYMHSCITNIRTPIFELVVRKKDTPALSCVIPHLRSLQKLELLDEFMYRTDDYNAYCTEIGYNYFNEGSLLRLFQQLPKVMITSLLIRHANRLFLARSPDIAGALQDLMHPSYGTLQELILHGPSYSVLIEDSSLIELVSSPSSLKHLSITGFALNTFNTNNNLTKLSINAYHMLSCLMPELTRIMENSQKLKRLQLSYFKADRDAELLKMIVSVLKDSSTLQTLKLIHDCIVDNQVNVDNCEELRDTLQKMDPRADLVWSLL